MEARAQEANVIAERAGNRYRARLSRGVDATHIVESILGVVREVVPEEEADVAAVLPKERKELWRAAVPRCMVTPNAGRERP